MYREVTMVEFREVLRLWQEQVPKKRIAARVGLDPKKVRRLERKVIQSSLLSQLTVPGGCERCKVAG